jgi:chemotaxis-related protein WspD
VTADEQAELTAYFARPRQLDERASETAVVFRVGGEWLALPTSVVQQITRPSRVHSLPHRRTATVLGIVNVDGELLVCASLAAIAGLGDAGTPASPSGAGRMLVIRHEGVRAACPVDEVHGVVRFHSGVLRDVPATLARANASLATSLLPFDGQFAGVLDTTKLFQALQRSFA